MPAQTCVCAGLVRLTLSGCSENLTRQYSLPPSPSACRWWPAARLETRFVIGPVALDCAQAALQLGQCCVCRAWRIRRFSSSAGLLELTQQVFQILFGEGLVHFSSVSVCSRSGAAFISLWCEASSRDLGCGGLWRRSASASVTGRMVAAAMRVTDCGRAAQPRPRSLWLSAGLGIR